MAYSWRPTELRDPLGDAIGKFDSGLAWGRDEKFTKEAPETFGKYLDSLGNATTSQALVQPGSGVTTNAMVNGSHDAATAAQDPLLSAFFQNARRSESGGNDAAKNPDSSATGRYQFLEGTWADLAQRHPELGLTPDGRTDPNQQERAMQVFTQENAGQLKGSGVPVNPGTLYAAHFLGAGGASKVLSGDPNSPVAAYVDPEVVRANPQLANMTVGQFAQWANEKGGNAGGGYQPPMAEQPQATAQAAGNGLPDRETMLALFKNPNTRPIAIQIAKTAEAERAAGRDPSQSLEMEKLRLEVEALRNPSKALTDLGKLKSDLDGGRISQAQYDAAVAKETSINGGTTLSVNPTTGQVEFSQGGIASGMPKLTEGQSKDTVFVTRASGALPILDNLESKLLSLGENVAGSLPLGNFLQSEDYQKANNAGREFLAAILRKDTGAAVTDQEMANYGATYIPQPGDKPGRSWRGRERSRLFRLGSLPRRCLRWSRKA